MKSRRFFRVGGPRPFALALSWAALGASPTRAQSTPPPEPAPASLASHFGEPHAERLLQSDSSKDKRRAFERLAALGSPAAIELLASALAPEGATNGVEERLSAVRALAPFAAKVAAREALERTLAAPPPDNEAGALAKWVRASAALALAQSQDEGALFALGRALRKPGVAAELAGDALVAHPPRNLAPILRASGRPTPELCRALGALGDLRATDALRDIARGGATADVRAAAALALLSLGSLEVVELARHWLAREQQPLLLATATEILLRTSAADAEGALGRLLQNEATRSAALSLATLSDGRRPLPAELTLELALGREGEWLTVLAGRARTGLDPRLERALSDPSLAGLALYALARAPGEIARLRLERALHEPALRALTLRALALRSVALGEGEASALAAARRLSASNVAAERAAAAFVTALLRPDDATGLLRSSDRVVVFSALRAAFHGPLAGFAVQRLLSERDPALRVALAVGLADDAAASRAPSALLLTLAHGGDFAAPLAAYALAQRADPELVPSLRSLLTSADPWLRAHTLLGLGRAREPEVLSLIEEAYRYEADEGARYAAVLALSARPELIRQRTLGLAANLDASSLVREAARLALRGQQLKPRLAGSDTFWLELAATAGLAPAAGRLALVRVGHGLALPLMADPDGIISLGGIDPAPAPARLAILGERVFVRAPRGDAGHTSAPE